MNTQTAGVWVKEYDNDTGLHDESFREWWIVTNGEYSFDCRSEKAADFLLSKLNIPALTIQQALEVWEDACKDLLKDIAQVFLDKSNQAKADTLRDAEFFQAVGETIENFPLRDKRTYFRYKFGIDIDKM